MYSTGMPLQKSLQKFTLVIVFIFSLKFFQSMPFEVLFFKLQAVFLGFALLFLVGYVVTKLLKGEQINKIIFYYLLLIAVIPFYSAYRAEVEFGQPFIYGFLSERAWLLFGVGIWLHYVLVTRKISFETMESSFIFMAWTSLVVFSLFILTYDPSRLQGSDEVSKLVYMTQSRGLRFQFQTYFITFGAIYYFVKYSTRKNHLDLFLVFLFLSYIVFIVQGRTYMITMAATFLFYWLFNHSLNKIILIFMKLSIFLFLALMFIQIFMPDYLARMGDLFVQMFTVLTGIESQDASANARIFQSQIVMNYFDAHPLSIFLGTGSVSNQWNNGYDSIFGYFYPSDIGVLGGLFVYGIVGFIFLFLVPFIVSVKTFRKMTEKKQVFIVALKYLLLFILVNSLQGSFYFGFIAYVIPLFILLAYLKMQERTAAN